jgi:hypothetical protein
VGVGDRLVKSASSSAAAGRFRTNASRNEGDEMAADRDAPSPTEKVARLYEQAESEAAKATERLVGSGGFVSLLGQFAENTAALTKLSGDALDMVLRNLHLAGRRDIIRLARQLARTEDKLERVLQEVEAVRDRLEREADGHPLVSSSGAASPASARAAPAARRAGTRSPRRAAAPDNGAGTASPPPPPPRKRSR